MHALSFDHTLQLLTDVPIPTPRPGEVLIRPTLAGICNTDIEITRGYQGTRGILGHEFVGIVQPSAQFPEWSGRRVVGEINLYCGQCPTCRSGHPGHCPHRTTLGINGHPGAMAGLSEILGDKGKG